MLRPLLLASLAALIPVQTRAERPLVLDGQVGPAVLTKSRSSAIGHAVKPIARLGLRIELMPRLEAGGSVSGIVHSNEHYRVLGAVAHGR
jgi:hypothetical protein